MSYINEFPHGRMWDSDLRQILEMYNTVKGLPRSWEEFSSQLNNDWTNLREFVNTYFTNLDVQNEINKKIDDLVADGTIELLLQEEFNGYTIEINARMNLLETRMNTFTALPNDATTGDAEVADARVDYKGKVWSNVGEHIRGVSSQLSSEIVGIKSDLGQLEQTDFTFTEGQFVDLSGAFASHGDYATTEYIPINGAMKLKYSDIYGSAGVGVIYRFDENKNPMELLVRGDANYTMQSGEIVVMGDGYIVVSKHRLNSPKLQVTYNDVLSNKAEILEMKQKINEFDSENPLSMLNSNVSLIRCFNRIVCIGDSLTQGVFNYTTEGNGNDYADEKYSYPSVLAKLTGCDVANYGLGGTTAYKGNTSWETFADKEQWLIEAHKGDAYIIALGTNDITALNSFTGNVDTDVDLSDYTQNANTSVGGYARIVSRILEVQPKAKLFFVTISNVRNDEATRTEANEKIRALAEKFGAYVIDLQAYAETTTAEQTYFANYYKNGSHNNALGYNLRARQYATYIDWIIKSNIADFQDIQFIGTDKSY